MVISIMICKNTKTKTQTPGKKKKTKQNKEGQYNTKRAFNIFQVCQYFTIYWPGGAFLLKFVNFFCISCATLFRIRRYQRPF